MLGKLIKSRNQMLFLFDLCSPEVRIRTTDDTGKIKTAKTPSYPADWQNQFGLPITEHDGQLTLSIFNDNAVFGLEKDPAGTSKEEIIATIKQESEEQRYEQLSLLESGLQTNTDNRPEETPDQDIQTNPSSPQ